MRCSDDLGVGHIRDLFGDALRDCPCRVSLAVRQALRGLYYENGQHGTRRLQDGLLYAGQEMLFC
jgi:hypothetical protein